VSGRYVFDVRGDRFDEALPMSADNSTRPAASVALTLDDDSLRQLARLVAIELSAKTTTSSTSTDGSACADGWLDAKAAAAYLGFASAHPLHKLTARREIAFSQDATGGKCWFRRSDLDAYRLQGRIEARDGRA
jgi:hypothetical protein